MEFNETPRFWYPHVALNAWTDFAFCSDENLLSDFHRSLREAKKEKKSSSPSILTIPFLPKSPFFSMCLSLIQVRFCPETIYLFSIQFILNELNSRDFLTFEIFVKISSLKSLATYPSKTHKKILIVSKFNEIFLYY